MNYTKILVSAALLMGALGASADKMSPDTRIQLQNRNNMMTINSDDVAESTFRVFIAFEPGFDPANLEIEGVQLQSVFNKLATADVTRSAIEKLNVMDGVRYIQIASEVQLRNNFGRRDLNVDAVHDGKGGLRQAYTGKGVVVGVIDTGLEYGHRAFYNEEGTETRIRRIWQQTVNQGTPPAGYNYGSELTTESAMLVKAYDTASQYHGTHTTATAAGGRDKTALDVTGRMVTKYYGMAPDADIVFVSFHNSENTAIADGIKYIFDYADEMGMPCVINMSLGSHHGPHDGTSYLDQIIDEMSGPGHIIVGACGNEGESRLHLSKTFTESETSMKTILTFNSTISHNYQYLDIWGTPGSDLKVNLGIINSLKGQTLFSSPVFDTSGDMKQINYYTYLDETGVEMDAAIAGEINPENNAPHIWIQANISNAGEGRMPALFVEGDPGATVHMWNEGQHEFSSNNKKGFTNGDNACTVGEIGGTANRIITVGSYDGRDTLFVSHGTRYALMKDICAPEMYTQYNHSVFSSYGPTADGRVVPHVLAPGMPVISALNRYAVETSQLDDAHSDYTTDASGRNYYYVYNMGTSMSAPHVAGIVALMLQANPDLTPEEARDIIQSTADTWDAMGETPNNTWGAGRINALECVKKALGESLADIVDASIDNDATQVWTDNGMINISTPVTGAKVCIYNVAGAMMHQSVLGDSFTAIDASKWGRGIYVVRISGTDSERSFKIAL